MMLNNLGYRYEFALNGQVAVDKYAKGSIQQFYSTLKCLLWMVMKPRAAFARLGKKSNYRAPQLLQ